MRRLLYKNKLDFIDFCAGIGGGRIGLENNGFNCLGFSEINDKAIGAYRELYGKDEINFGDLTKANDIPNFDLLISGFPCQTFSIAGKREGFNDHRGNIIYGLLNILKNKNVPFFILENVKGLVSHNKGETLKTILKELGELDYKVFYEVLDSINFGVPQMRERIYFVGIKKSLFYRDFTFPKGFYREYNISNFLDENNKNYLNMEKHSAFYRYLNNKYNKDKVNINEILSQDYLVVDTRQSDLRTYKNKFPTLRAGRTGLLYVKNRSLVKLNAIESLILQGFGLETGIKLCNKLSSTDILRLSGNAMTVNVIDSIANELINYIEYK